MMDNNNEKHGVTVHGDYVGGDQVTSGSVVGSVGVAIGHGAQASVVQTKGDPALAQAFSALYRRVAERPVDPAVEREEIGECVRKIEGEAAKGEQANASKVHRWLAYLQTIAPDIFEAATEVLKQPLPGLSASVRDAAQQASGAAGAPSGFERVLAELAASGLPAEATGPVQDELQALRSEAERGDAADVRTVRVTLSKVVRSVPILRQPLYSWLDASPKTSTPVKIIARKLLAE
jgi:hypothetical protein